MQNKIKKNTKKKLLIRLLIVLVICFILYLLANRYLIEHVTIKNAFNISEQETTESDSLSDAQTVIDSEFNTINDIPNFSSTNVKNNTSDVLSYKSDTISIQINPKTTGAGNTRITYFVADILLKDSSSLKAAFAKNQFGTNIVQHTSTIAKANHAIFAINGDYYGFRKDGIVIRNGKVFRDSPARMGLAFYSNGLMKSYDETTTTADELKTDGVTQTLSFGPVLVKDGVAITEFGKTIIDTNFGNRSIENSNPRTGIGIISANHYVFVVVDGRSIGYSKGMTLSEFAKVFEDLGCTDAYNLDGGGSTTMYFNGKVINNPLGKGKERGVSDILYIN